MVWYVKSTRHPDMLMDFTRTFYISYGSMLLLGLSLCATGKQYWGVGIFAMCIAWAMTISLILTATRRGYIFLLSPSFVIGVLTFVAGFSPTPLLAAFTLVYYGMKYLSFCE
jgi:ABC-type arginine/histidine transport system permease subunit